MSFHRVEITLYINRSLIPRPGMQVSRLDALKRDTQLERIGAEIRELMREFDLEHRSVDLLTHPGSCPFREDLGSREFIVAVEGRVVLDSRYKPGAITRAVRRSA